MVYSVKSGRTSKSITALASLSFLAIGCSDGNNNSTFEILKPQPPNPVVEKVTVLGGGSECCKILGGVIDLRDQNYTPGTAFYSGLAFDASEVGYRETEFFIAGTATSYVATDDLKEDGVWSVQEADAAEYRTRIVVRRPIDPEKFNGTVTIPNHTLIVLFKYIYKALYTFCYHQPSLKWLETTGQTFANSREMSRNSN